MSIAEAVALILYGIIVGGFIGFGLGRLKYERKSYEPRNDRK